MSLSGAARSAIERHAIEIERIEVRYQNFGRSAYPTAVLPGTVAPAVDAALAPFAADLLRTRLSRQPVFLTQMISGGVSSAAFYRALLVINSQLRSRARSQPLPWYFEAARERDGQAFEMHSDLHARRRLLLVYDQVPATGARALLLPRSQFLRTLKQIAAPVGATKTLCQILDDRSAADAYERFMTCLYGRQWSTRTGVAAALMAAATEIPFRRGEGYLVHDRRWLHGRRAGGGVVDRDRFRRMLF